jgi:hypothetical protein
MVFGDWKATAKQNLDFVQTGKVDTNTGDIIALTKEEIAVEEQGDASDSIPLKERPVKRKRKNLIPDYALMMENDGSPRAVGEAKTPWNHDFERLWLDVQDSETKFSMRRALGMLISVACLT